MVHRCVSVPLGPTRERVLGGGFVEQDHTFGGYTMPTCMRIGWHFGTEAFEPEGEFFRVVIDNAVYR